MEDCCSVEPREATPSTHCAACGHKGRRVDGITLKALLTPAALERREPGEYRFCATTACEVVYFGAEQRFERGDLTVPVFQKEPPGARTVCHCFDVGEEDIRQDVAAEVKPTSFERISSHVQAGRCACEVRNPQGSCCLGNIKKVMAEAEATTATRV